MIYKPHTVRVYAATETAAGPPTYAAIGVPVKCQVTPMSFETAFKATGKELKRPHMLLAEPTDKEHLFPGNKVVHGGDIFFVHTDAATYELGTPADNAMVVISQSQYAA